MRSYTRCSTTASWRRSRGGASFFKAPRRCEGGLRLGEGGPASVDEHVSGGACARVCRCSSTCMSLWRGSPGSVARGRWRRSNHKSGHEREYCFSRASMRKRDTSLS